MMTVGQVRKVQGFSLIEVLVTLVIAAVGLLGIAAIVLFSMRASFEASQQTIAALLAIDTHERAWLSTHVAAGTCTNDWIVEEEFSPKREIAGLLTRVDGLYPNCVFTVEWEESAVGVVGGMAGFGGIYTHNFTIPSTVTSEN